MRDFFFFFFFLYSLIICAIFTNMYQYLHIYISPLGASLLVDLLGSHNWSEMVEL